MHERHQGQQLGRALIVRFACSSIRKQTVRSRPNSGHYDETNKVLSAAAAFRRPLPPSERRQLGGKLTVRFKDIETNSSSHRPSIRYFADDKSS